MTDAANSRSQLDLSGDQSGICCASAAANLEFAPPHILLDVGAHQPYDPHHSGTGELRCFAFWSQLLLLP